MDVFANWTLIYDLCPILIIAAIVPIVQVILIMFHKINIYGKILRRRNRRIEMCLQTGRVTKILS